MHSVLKKIPILYLFLLCLTGHAQTIDSLGFAMPDSLYQKQLNQLDSIQRQTRNEFEGLKEEYDSIQQEFGKPIARLQHKTDSLRKLNLPTDTYTKKLDSLTQLKEEKLTAVKGKTEALKAGSIEKINNLKLPPEISKEAQQFTEGLNKLDVSFPGTDLNFPTIPSLSALPNLSLPGIDAPTLPNISPPGIDTALPQGIDVKTPEALEEIKQVTDQVSEIQDKIGNPPAKEEVIARAEEKAAEAEPVKDVTKKIGGLSNESLIADGQITKEELKEQVKEQAIDHFAGQEEQLQAAMGQISKLKQKYNDVQSIKDLPKKVPNPMKGKPFIERVVPGVAFQLLLKNDWLMDFNPYVGYRFSGRIVAGLGWNQRWAFTEEYEFNSQARIYGPRLFGEYIISKGFAGRLELETMNTVVPPLLKQPPNPELAQREWVPGIFAGLKKEYKINKRINGTAFVLYNLYNPYYKSPYGDRLMTRFGFEYLFVKKKKERAS